MRSLVFSHEKMSSIIGTHFCCECNLCSLIACPEDLDPKNVCIQNKRELREQKIFYPEDIPSRPVHGMLDGRRTPVSRLIVKLGLKQFENKGPLTPLDFEPDRVVIPLKQHVGAPASPAVSVGERVNVGDLIGSVSDDQLGVSIHASIQGTVYDMNENQIEIRKS